MTTQNNNLNNTSTNLVYTNIALLTDKFVHEHEFEQTDFEEIFNTIADHLYFSSAEVQNRRPDLYYKRKNLEETHAKYYNLLLTKIKTELDEVLKKDAWLNYYPCQKRIEINKIIEEQKKECVEMLTLFKKYLIT